MFDWFNRHKWLGMVLMSVLLVTMGVSYAMIEVMSGWFRGEDASGIAFEAVGRPFTLGEIDEMRTNVALGSLVSFQPSLVVLDRDADIRRGIDTREAAIRLILLEHAKQSGLHVSQHEVDKFLDDLRTQNEKGVERNLRRSGRTWDDIARYWRNELLLQKLISYEWNSIDVSFEDAYEEMENDPNESEGGSRYGWVKLAYEDSYQEIVGDLEGKLYEQFVQFRSQLQTPRQVSAEYVLVRVDAEHTDEELEAYRAANPRDEWADKPFADIKEEIATAMTDASRAAANTALVAFAQVLDEDGMEGAPWERIVERFHEKTENAHVEALETGSTGGLVLVENLPEDLKTTNFERSVASIKPEGGILRLLAGREDVTNFRSPITHYVCARVDGHVVPEPMSFKDVQAEGYEPLLEAYYERNSFAFTEPERRTVDFAIADYATFAEVGEVDEGELQELYDAHKESLWSGDEAPTFEEARDELAQIVRKRDAVELAKSAVEELKERAESLGSTVQLLALAVDSPVKVFRVTVHQNDRELQQTSGLDQVDEMERSRLYSLAFGGLTAEDIDAGKCSTIFMGETSAFVARVVSSTPGEKPPVEDVRGRLLDMVIEKLAIDEFRERARTLSQRMNLPAPGAEDPEDWTDAEKKEWRHKNLTRFASVAEKEELEVHQTETFYKPSDDEVEVLSEVRDFDRYRPNLNLSQVMTIPPSAGSPQQPGFDDDRYLVTVLETAAVPKEEATLEQLERIQMRLRGERQSDRIDELRKLSWLKEQDWVQWKARATDIENLDLSDEMEEEEE